MRLAVVHHAVSVLFVAVLATGCAQKGAAPAEGAAAAPAAAEGKAPDTRGKVGPGMNAQGEVVDTKKVESGWGKTVKGLDDWEGEITGKPALDGKFSKLQIGMGIKQVMDLAGPPTDQGSYVSGKAFIPLYFGSDRTRYELVYKGTGRLVFAGGNRFSRGSRNLIWIIHSANEGGYR